MQPRFTVGILVLQAEGLVCVFRYLGFTLQFALTVVISKPDCLRHRLSLLGC